MVKKNGQRTIGYGKAKRVIYSPQYMRWEVDAMAQLQVQPRPKTPIAVPFGARFRLYFQNHQAEPDASNAIEGVQDLLKKMSVIADDRLIHVLHVEKHFNELPRIEIELFHIDQTNWPSE